MAISQAELARELGVSRAAVCQMVKRGCPLTSVDDALAWRAVNMVRQPRAKGKVAKGKREVVAEPVVESGEALPDFDAEMLRQAESVTAQAFELYNRAVRADHPVQVAAALKNWSEAAKNAASIRERFLAIQVQARNLVSLDEVLADVAEEVAEWRRGFVTLGNRLVGKIPPESVAEVNGAVDEIFEQMSRAELRARKVFDGPSS